MKKKIKGGQSSPLIRVALGAATCIGTVGAACLLVSAIAMLLPSPLAATGAGALIALLLSGVICGIFLPRVTEGELLLPALSSLSAVLLLLGVGLIMGKGHLSPGCPLNYSCFMALTMAVAYLISKKRGRRHLPPKRRT